MKRIGRISVTLSIIFSLSSLHGFCSDSDAVSILLIGSSYFLFNELPDMLDSLIKETDREFYIDQYCPPGYYLSDHASSITTEAKIREKTWDYIVLQGVGRLMAYPDVYTDHPVYDALKDLKAIIEDNYRATKIIFYLPWAYEDGMTWLGWEDDYFDMQEKIHHRKIEYSDDLGFMVAHVGMACVIYSALSQESANGIDYFSGLPEEEASRFQTIAAETVLDDLRKWNITGSWTLVEDNFTHSEIFVSQNFPNPVRYLTSICFEISALNLLSYGFLSSPELN